MAKTLENHNNRSQSEVYTFYLENPEMIDDNSYYAPKLNQELKIQLFYQFVSKNVSNKLIIALLDKIAGVYYLSKKSNQKEKKDFFLYVIELHKQGKINLNESQYRFMIYPLDPFYFLEEDINNIAYLGDINNHILLIHILDYCKEKKFAFKEEHLKFLKVFNDDGALLIYFINNCQFEDIRTKIINILNAYDSGRQKFIYDNIEDYMLKAFLYSHIYCKFGLRMSIFNTYFVIYVQQNKDDVLAYLKMMKEKNYNKHRIILAMSHVDMDFIDKAHQIYGSKLEISPTKNQQRKKNHKGWWYPTYTVPRIKKIEEKIDTYSKTVLDKKDKDGDIKHLSPLERFIAAYIIDIKFHPYRLEKYPKRQYHLSRSVYELFDDNMKYMVCVGYIYVLEELLYRMGNYKTCELEVLFTNNKAIGESGAINHSRMLIYLEDPKYGIKGIYMSDPTFDIDGLHNDGISHMLMSKNEALNNDKQFRYKDLHLDNTFIKSGLELSCDEEEIEKMFGRPIPKDTIVRAFLAVFQFLDKNRKMDGNYTPLEYRKMEISLGYRDGLDRKGEPSFEEAFKMTPEELAEYQSAYLWLHFSFGSDFHEYLKKDIPKREESYLPLLLFPDICIAFFDSDIPYIEEFKRRGYVQRNETMIDIFKFKDDVPINEQYNELVERIKAAYSIIDNLSLESNNNDVK